MELSFALLTLCDKEIRVSPKRLLPSGVLSQTLDLENFTTACRSFVITRSSAIAEGPRDASCQLKSCQLPRNSAETTYTTSPDQIDGMKLEI